MTSPDAGSPSAPPQTFAGLIESDWVTNPTRKALQAKLAGPTVRAPGCLSEREFAVLKAAVGRLVPQTGSDAAPLAEIIAANLTSDQRDGWRYDVLPRDQEAYSLGLRGLDETARSLFQAGFVELSGADQDKALSLVQNGLAPKLAWARIAPQRFFEDMLCEAIEAYASHPCGQAAMGYRGMADAKGFHAIGLDQRDPVDIDAPNAKV